MIIKYLGKAKYGLQSDSGKKYLVTLMPKHPFKGECNCPDYIFRNKPCKHLLNVLARINDNLVGVC